MWDFGYQTNSNLSLSPDKHCWRMGSTTQSTTAARARESLDVPLPLTSPTLTLSP